MNLRMIMVYSRPVTPMIVGLCLGIALSLILAPFMDEDCQMNVLDVETGRNVRKTNSIIENDKPVVEESQATDDDFEPHLIQDKPKHPSGYNKKFVRPRYTSTELGIREKLFIGVLTSRETIGTLGVAINKTVSHYVSKLVFFMDKRGASLPSGMSIVSFSDDRPNLKPFHMLKYIGDHYINTFDWFMFIPDTTYIRGEKIFDMMSHISITNDLHFGLPVAKEGSFICNLDYGLIVSQSILSKVISSLDWCSKNTVSGTTSDNIGKCILHASGKACTNQRGNKKFTIYSSPGLDKSLDISFLQKSHGFNEAITVYRMKDELASYRLHRHFCELALNESKVELEKTKDDIIRMSYSAPGGRASATWPIGIPPPFKPKTRFDVIRWDYFTETQIFLENDFSNVKPLTGVHKLDVDDVITTSLKRLNEKYGDIYNFGRLVNGYRRFDPTRGMEYTLDLTVKEKFGKSTEIHKRVHLVRPLSQVEIVPMPYVTENTRVNLILPVSAEDRDGVVSFLDSYAHTCLDSGDNTNLFIVFIYNPQDPIDKDDIFAVLKSMITYYENKYQNGARIAWTSIHSSSPNPEFIVMDAVSKKFPPQSLFLICSVGMELAIEFLNRVRMNTISGWQAFFPIGFYQYKPNLIYDETPYPTTIEINKNVGHFDNNLYEQASFYNSDYQYARKTISDSVISKIEMYDMFIKYHHLHVFRAIEPALKHRFRERHCKPTLTETAYKRCLKSIATGLASRSQLALLIFEEQRKVDKLQIDIKHRQHDPNVELMKPDMLK
ncbi:unnamed protein product [Owenia fusiformis]|uniref:Hexosyltransferase n=1 Tax=Owenia fusiformis TaxID=6347 RepID=A0A8J1Y4S0_OWEFU|nr:unnamed protein product [Owenia fusiformis]